MRRQKASGVSEFEEVLDEIGPWGRWQKYAAAMNAIMSVVTAIQTLSYPMLSGKFDYWCAAALPNSTFGASWTSAQIRNFTTPADAETAVERGCHYYRRDYDAVGSSSSYAEALLQRNVASPNVAQCDDVGGPARWHYESEYYGRSLTNEFDLVCGRLWLEPTFHFAFTIGCFIGVFLFGQLSDLLESASDPVSGAR